MVAASADLRSIRRPAGTGRAGEGDLIGVSRRSGCTDTAPLPRRRCLRPLTPLESARSFSASRSSTLVGRRADGGAGVRWHAAGGSCEGSA